MSALEVYKGPTSWNKDAGTQWHLNCPQEPDSEVREVRGVLKCACGASEKMKEKKV